MRKVVGIKFKPAGKIYDFDCGAFVLDIGDHVIVETDFGLSFGYVAALPRPIEERKSKSPLKKVFRKATEDDLRRLDKNEELEKRAYDFCQKSVDELDLKMNLFSVESTFDTGKLTFFFTADGRVDFRQLVKNLVREFRTRIEMRQVGIRNQAKMCGGLGRCGRVICCSSFMRKFEPVSIRMAKIQNLSLNPTKISGQCGRLMCCLVFEADTYNFLRKKLPNIGKMIKTEKGEGKVIRHNPILGTVVVRMADGFEIEHNLDKNKNESTLTDK